MNTREREISKQINDGQAESHGIAVKGIEHTNSTTKNSKDKCNERKKKKTLGKRSNGVNGLKNLELEA